MNKEDIYVGTIKRCINIYNYEKYGEHYQIDDYRIGNMTVGTVYSTVETIDTNAILVKTEHGYIELKKLDGLFADIKLSMEMHDSIMFDKPIRNGELFVDKSTLVQYNGIKEDNITVKKLRKKLNI